MPLVQILANKDRLVSLEPVPADISIVIDGMLVNPLSIYGRKALLFFGYGWGEGDNANTLYKEILAEYYDDIIDASDMTLGQTVQALFDYEIQATDRLQQARN